MKQKRQSKLRRFMEIHNVTMEDARYKHIVYLNMKRALLKRGISLPEAYGIATKIAIAKMYKRIEGMD